jgi:tetratricopeptide (TPR) repeat protein
MAIETEVLSRSESVSPSGEPPEAGARGRRTARRLLRLGAMLLVGIVLIAASLAYRNRQLPRFAAQRRQSQQARELAARQAAVAARPNDVNARWALATWQMEAEQPAEAESELRAILRIDPGHRSSRLALAQIMTLQRRFQEALGANREIIRRWPDDPAGYAGAALCYRQLDELADGLRMARLALARSPQAANSHYLVGTIALDYAGQAANRRARKEEYRLAVRMLEKVVKAVPDHWDAHTRLGRAYLALEQPEQAREHLRQALALNPGAVEALASLAEAADTMGDRAAVKVTAEQWIAYHPRDPRGYYWKGYAGLHGRGELASAIQALAQAARMDPARSLYHEQLGIALARANRLQEARAAFEEAVRQDPNRPFPLQQLALIYTRLGDTANAGLAARDARALTHNQQKLEYYQGQVQAHPGNVALHLVLADRYHELGWYTQARDEYRVVLRLDPSNRRAAAGLRAVEVKRRNAASSR